jgi:hypothetical protein
MADIDVDALVAGAVALSLAGQRDLADRLLAADTDDAVDRLTLAATAARVEVDDAVWGGAPRSTAAVDRLAGLLAASASASPAMAWDLDLLRLRVDYSAALAGADTDRAALSGRAGRLLDRAPDAGRAGWAAFYVGAIADNIDERADVAVPAFRRALTAADETGDDLLASYALRHLGGHALDSGDLAAARDLLWRSAELRERLGFVPGALAQRILLADLLARQGDRPGAVALAADVARAARARGWTRLAAQAEGLLT